MWYPCAFNAVWVGERPAWKWFDVVHCLCAPARGGAGLAPLLGTWLLAALASAVSGNEAFAATAISCGHLDPLLHLDQLWFEDAGMATARQNILRGILGQPSAVVHGLGWDVPLPVQATTLRLCTMAPQLLTSSGTNSEKVRGGGGGGPQRFAAGGAWLVGGGWLLVYCCDFAHLPPSPVLSHAPALVAGGCLRASHVHCGGVQYCHGLRGTALSCCRKVRRGSARKLRGRAERVAGPSFHFPRLWCWRDPQLHG